MTTAFGRMFWGLLLVWIDIRIGMDILPNPVGYFLISAGVSVLLAEYPIGKKAYSMAILLGVVSIPTVFIPQDMINDITQGWGMYYFVLGLLKLVLMFYLFQLMLTIGQVQQEDDLVKRTSNTMKIYIITLLVVYIIMPFTMNLYGNTLSAYIIISTGAVFILEIVFLILLRRFRRLDKDLGDFPVDGLEK